MSKTGYYTGAEEVSASRGEFSTTDSTTPNYTDGWAEIRADEFSVSSSGGLPLEIPGALGLPGERVDLDLSDANKVMLVTVEIKDINMLSEDGEPCKPNYPFCSFPKEFNVLEDWSGEFYRGRNTAKIRDYDSEADAKADATLASPDTWVWYDKKWVSLIGNNPGETFFAYGTNSSGQTEYFQHRTVKESGLVNDDLRYVEQARVRLSKNTISSEFVTTYKGTRCAMMLLIPFKATEHTLGAVGTAENFSNTQVFYAVNDIGETLYNVDKPNTIPTYYNTQNDSTEWTRLPGFYRNVSNAEGEMPYFKKAKTYTYLTAFNVNDEDKYDISKRFNSGNAEGAEENIAKATWIPYQRTDPISVEATDDGEKNYVVWNDETGGWELRELETLASRERRILGIIIQAPGGSGGPGADGGAFSGGGGGGGAYCELMVNAYNTFIRVNLAKPNDWNHDQSSCNVEVWSNDGDRVRIICSGGQGGGTGKWDEYGSGGVGGTVVYGIRQNARWTYAPIANKEMAVVPTSTETGDKNTVKWYSPNGVGNFSWDTPNIGVVAAVAGGDGGNGGFASTPELRKNPEDGKQTFKTQKYYVAGIPSEALTWESELAPFSSENPGAARGLTDDDPSIVSVDGGGGGASYYGRGGHGGGAEGHEGEKGGGAGGSGNDTSGWTRGAEGVFLLLK